MTQKQASSGGSIAYEWWRRLNPLDGSHSGASRAALARMRRAATPTQVLLEPEALRLITMLPQSRKDRVAILAGVLAFVREVDEPRIARAIGRTSLDDEQSAKLSEARFRRLLQSQPSELMDPLRRLVRQMKGRVNVGDLADAILYWGDGVKKKWIFDYYGVALAAPSAASTTDSTQTLQQDLSND